MRAAVATPTNPTPADPAPALPPALADLVRRTRGAVLAAHSLRGQSLNDVLRLRCADGTTLIAKRCATPHEPAFYRALAPALRARGIPIPALEGAASQDGAEWLLLEDVPGPLPRERWLADPHVLATLARLHTFAPPAGWLAAARAAPYHRHEVWSQTAAQDALSLFDPETARRLRPYLDALRDAAQQQWTARVAWISGDPNPTNWGLRADGTAVLFDWERFGAGPIALDLAITIPGLGDPASFARVASAYVDALSQLAQPAQPGQLGQPGQPGTAVVPDPAALSRELAIAKCNTVVEFLAAAATRRSRPAALAPLLQAVPGWLAERAGALTA